MPRPAMTPTQRFVKTKIAYDRLPDAMLALAESIDRHGYGSPEQVAAAETVEGYAAEIHRQSRLLAGKARGG